LDVTPDAIIAPFKSFPLQCLEENLGTASVLDRLYAVLGEELLETILKLTELWPWLLGTGIALLGNVVSDDLLDGILGQVKLAGYLPDRFLVPVVRLADLSDGFHYQHLLSVLLSLDESKEHGGSAEVGQYWTPITPPNGSLLHADSQYIL
jgi:hypothetical protein